VDANSELDAALGGNARVVLGKGSLYLSITHI
jgi:hypothetical protein